ncbi:hypothetical protein LOAG_01545 [Loa loa]|uniref:Uncharacterized protein n=1 Tax=Loa loa TaxID=7209 RepID=A0A1S0U977_LOALO|nr:hypothetical protein LOAG_01545 [Loa loa]EFO26938.1 hypothetical protein LOAG_01545 [Loa loa]
MYENVCSVGEAGVYLVIPSYTFKCIKNSRASASNVAIEYQYRARQSLVSALEARGLTTILDERIFPRFARFFLSRYNAHDDVLMSCRGDVSYRIGCTFYVNSCRLYESMHIT